MTDFKSGDRVEWNAGAGKASGTIQDKITDRKTIDGNPVKASPDDPRYLVKNDHTGKVTAHTAQALNRASQSNSAPAQPSDPSSEQNDERSQTIEHFQQVVNMTAKELQDWLQTEESQSVGQTKENDEAIGHQSGRQIVEILQTQKADYTDDDLQHMGKVYSYVQRHSAQKPSGDVKQSRWRYSLMNWGHDPLKE